MSDADEIRHKLRIEDACIAALRAMLASMGEHEPREYFEVVASLAGTGLGSPGAPTLAEFNELVVQRIKRLTAGRA